MTAPTDSERSPSRRDLLRGGAAVVAVAACSGCGLFRSLSKPDVVFPAGTAVVRLSAGDHAALAEVGGVVRMVVGEDTRILLVRGSDRRIRALSMSCTHFGSDLGYDTTDGVLACPSHGSRFGLDGAVIEGPADEPLEEHGVSEEEGVITVQVG